MGRAPLRPALRAYAHAPPAVETAAPWSNAYSMYHDGTDDGWTSIGTSTPTIDAFKDALSVSYWINTTSQGGGRMHLWLSPPFDASIGPFWARMRIQIRHQGSDGKLLVRVGNATSTFASTTTNTSWSATAEDLYGKWAHVAVTVGAGTSSNVKIYIDGALDVTGTSPSSAWATSEDIEVNLMGAPDTATTFTGFKNGYMDEVSLYESELSAANITALYNCGTPAEPSSLGLTPKLYYRMGDLTDTDGLSGVVVDRMGTGMDLDSLGAPAKSTDVPLFTPASIPGTLLWIDPADDSTITYSSGNVPSTISDKGYLNTAWNITADTLSSQTFSFSGFNYTIGTITGVGNGNNWFRFDPAGGYRSAYSTLTPTGSPYNLTSGTGSAAIESDWFLWHVIYVENTGSTGNKNHAFYRGRPSNTPAWLANITAYGMGNSMTGDWTSSLNFNSIVGETLPTGYVSFIGCQSYDDGGTRKYRYTQDGVNWFGEVAHGRTNGTPSAASNVWYLQLGTTSDLALQGMGDAGFVSGTISADDMLCLYKYLDAKWGFDLP